MIVYFILLAFDPGLLHTKANENKNVFFSKTNHLSTNRSTAGCDCNKRFNYRSISFSKLRRIII